MSATNVIEMKNSNSKQSQGSLTYAFHEHQLSAPVIHSTIYLQEQNRISRVNKTGKMANIWHLPYKI